MIYIVEDDDNIRELIAYTLNHSGFKTSGFPLPSEFWKAINETLPEAVLLDIMLPEEDGLQILKKLRANSATARIPVMMITARGSEYDKVIGLDSGADDYLAKPFGMMELVARIKALLRRSSDVPENDSYTLEDLYVCPAKHLTTVAGEPVSLTHKEFELLCMLMKNREVVLTRDQLLNTIWGYSFDGENRTVDVHVRTLRQKLGKCGDLIETVRGVGYKIRGVGHEA
ncbi:MAG: response regulator transcription factor [Lachnospiraceae bacterium]|nr:response regulator transcription factor [Lachnospiraceae bacterium]